MAVGQANAQPAPAARRVPTESTLHGFRRRDDYAWMHDDRAGLEAYLRDERAWYDAATAHSRPLRARLYDEMSRRMAPTDRSVSWRH